MSSFAIVDPVPGLLRRDLSRTLTFRISVLGGFVMRLGVGGMSLLLPLLYPLGLGLPASRSGRRIVPAALAAMSIKVIAAATLRRFGYRQALIVNTVLVGGTIARFAFAGPGSTLAVSRFDCIRSFERNLGRASAPVIDLAQHAVLRGRRKCFRATGVPGAANETDQRQP